MFYPCSIRGRKFLPKPCQFFRPEIGQYLSIYLNHRSEILPGKADHFIKSRAIGDDIELFIFNIVFVKPAHRLVTPRTIGLDE